jgi:cytochrome b561
MTTSEPGRSTLTMEERQQVLNRYVAEATRQGWRVMSQAPTQAQLVSGKPTSHLLHLVLTLITLGIWAIVWILVAIFGGEKQRFVSVDEWGTVSTS